MTATTSFIHYGLAYHPPPLDRVGLAPDKTHPISSSSSFSPATAWVVDGRLPGSHQRRNGCDRNDERRRGERIRAAYASGGRRTVAPLHPGVSDSLGITRLRVLLKICRMSKVIHRPRSIQRPRQRRPPHWDRMKAVAHCLR